MKDLKFKIESASPLMQHDDKAANPFNEYAKKLKAISSKRKKTEDDLWVLAETEWEAGLYYKEMTGYYMKPECLEGSFYEAAKAKKLGKTFKESVRVVDIHAPFHFEHEKLSPKQLFKIDDYRDFRTVKIQRAKILRCRPLFNKWKCEFNLQYDESRMNEQELIDIVIYAGKYTGLCDYRPKYGRFNVTETKRVKKEA